MTEDEDEDEAESKPMDHFDDPDWSYESEMMDGNDYEEEEDRNDDIE